MSRPHDLFLEDTFVVQYLYQKVKEFWGGVGEGVIQKHGTP